MYLVYICTIKQPAISVAINISNMKTLIVIAAMALLASCTNTQSPVTIALDNEAYDLAGSIRDYASDEDALSNEIKTCTNSIRGLLYNVREENRMLDILLKL